MLALLASALFLAYFVVPVVLFRLVFGLFLPLKALDQTRTQDQLAHYVIVCAGPFILTLLLVSDASSRFGPTSFSDSWQQREADYSAIVLACFSDEFRGEPATLWGAARRTYERQERNLLWYLLLVAIEATVLGAITSRWGRIRAGGWLKRRKKLRRALESVLLGNVSEWHILLTNSLFPGQTMHIDLLTTDDHLYQGDVLSYTKDEQGKLTGIYLSNAQRFSRSRLLADRQAGKMLATASYWVTIPGERLYVLADRLSSLNVRPRIPPDQATAAVHGLAQGIGRQIGAKVDVSEQPADRPSPPDRADAPSPP